MSDEYKNSDCYIIRGGHVLCFDDISCRQDTLGVGQGSYVTTSKIAGTERCDGAVSADVVLAGAKIAAIVVKDPTVGGGESAHHQLDYLSSEPAKFSEGGNSVTSSSEGLVSNPPQTHTHLSAHGPNSYPLAFSSPTPFNGKVFDASGCYVVPGLIDCHVHAYQYATPLGIDVDEFCLRRGVTTAVDAGSAGAATFAGLRKYVAEQRITRVLSFIHIAAQGLAASGCAGGAKGGECDSLNVVDVDGCVSCIRKNRDMVVGVKVRLSSTVADDGRNEEEIYRRALDASNQVAVPLMVHHTISSIPVVGSDNKLSCPGDLRCGDIYTHTYHGLPSTIIDEKSGNIHSTLWDARKRGVFFDVGHGEGSFTWTVAEICAQNGFWPDIISTDLHSGNTDGPAYDLVTVMSKFLHLGMSIADIVKAVTETPARAIQKSEDIGKLAIGREADVTVLRIEECDVTMEDSYGQQRRIRQRIIPVAVFRAGKLYEVRTPDVWPNIEKAKLLSAGWNELVIKDKEKPHF
eukprot:XP_014790616.1 PREDICTED: deacetylase EF_0837-like [Octopus bimaculoides]